MTRGDSAGRGGAIAVMARGIKSLPALRFTKLDEVFTYGIVRRLGASSTSMVAGSGPPLAKPRAPVWASVFGDPSGMVDLARAVTHRRGGKLNTAARVLIFTGQNSS
jgi:hypothetical protein